MRYNRCCNRKFFCPSLGHKLKPRGPRRCGQWPSVTNERPYRVDLYCFGYIFVQRVLIYIYEPYYTYI